MGQYDTTMYEFFKDSPALQWMEADARADERRKADQRVLEERKKALTMSRQTVITLVAQRFPGLERLAKAQVRTLKLSTADPTPVASS